MGILIWLIQQIKDIIVKLFNQGQRLGKLAVNLLTWWVPLLICDQAAITCIIKAIYINLKHSLDETRTSIALRANTSKKSEGWKQMSARQEHESQHWENQCSTLFIYFLFKCSTMWSKSSSGFPCRIKNPFLH